MLILWYSKIPSKPNKDTKIYEVHQEFDMNGVHKSRVIELSCIKALCPLSPLIEGDCPQDLVADICFSVISKYHINPYLLHSHFHHLHGAAL